jgi:SAM-dependent methyltransferase
MEALAEKIRERAAAPVERAVELGCSVGRGLAELQAGARLVVGVELNFGAARRARRLLSGAPLAWARKTAGRHYRPASAQAGERAAPDAALVCGDALDPPLVPGTFDRVAAFNVIDSVRSPAQLLSVMDGLLKPGGEILISSPYTWQSGIVAEEERLGAHDPAAELARRLRDGVELEARYTVEDEAELTWWLRRDARSGQAYTVHYLRARKAQA